MKLHPRRNLVIEAKANADSALYDILSELTPWEEVQVRTSLFADFMHSKAKYGIREERHGDLDKPGGEA